MAYRTQRIAGVLRRFGLLELADQFMLVSNYLRNRSANKRFLAEHPDFLPPPISLAYDAYGNIDWRAIDLMGHDAANLIARLIRQYLPDRDLKVCEWGCGPGRVLRHFGSIEGFDKVKLFGSDYNVKSIEWCRAHIKDAHFEKNNLLPPLPFDSSMFDCIYSISVFTHLSESMHFDWIKDLSRVLAPDGILIFTTHGDRCAQHLLPEERARYDAGRLVVRGGVSEGKKHFLAYHPPSFVREELLEGMTVLKHLQCDSLLQGFHQDVWVVRSC